MNPTLQVYRGRSDVYEQVTFTIVGGESGTTLRTSLAFGSPDGTQEMSFSSDAVSRSLNLVRAKHDCRYVARATVDDERR